MAPQGKRQKKKVQENMEVGSLAETDMGKTEKEHSTLDRTRRAESQQNEKDAGKRKTQHINDSTC